MHDGDETEAGDDSPLPPVAMAYWEGWTTAPIPNLSFQLGLTFAQLAVGASGDYYTVFSNDFQTWGTPAYIIWNSWLTAHGSGSGGAITLVSYGGGNDTVIRPAVISGNLDSLAGELVANVQKFYFGGLDIDAEGWWNYDFAQNTQFATNLATVVKTVGGELPSWKPITVTVAATAAGAVDGIDPSSAYDGSMLPLFQDSAAMGFISRINIMAYNLPNENLYSDFALLGAILKNYTDAGVPKSKLSIGIQPVQNVYAPHPPPLQAPVDLATVQALGEWLAQNGYGGGFLWAIGDQYMPASPDATAYLTALMTGLGLPTNPASGRDVDDAQVDAEIEDSFE